MKTPSLICKIYDLTTVAAAMVLHRLPDESMILIPHHTNRQHIYNSNCIDFCLLCYCLAESLCVCRALLSRFSIQIQIFSDKTGRHTRETEPSKTLTTSMTKSHTQHLYYLIGRLRLWRARFKCEMDVWIYEYHVNCNLFHSIPTITLRTSLCVCLRVFICFFFSFFRRHQIDRHRPETKSKLVRQYTHSLDTDKVHNYVRLQWKWKWLSFWLWCAYVWVSLMKCLFVYSILSSLLPMRICKIHFI